MFVKIDNLSMSKVFSKIMLAAAIFPVLAFSQSSITYTAPEFASSYGDDLTLFNGMTYKLNKDKVIFTCPKGFSVPDNVQTAINKAKNNYFRLGFTNKEPNNKFIFLIINYDNDQDSYSLNKGERLNQIRIDTTTKKLSRYVDKYSQPSYYYNSRKDNQSFSLYCINDESLDQWVVEK